MLERYFIPLAPLFLLAAVSIGGLLYFACLERELSRMKSRLRGPGRADPGLGQSLRLKLEDLSARLQDAEDRASVAVAATPPKPSLNLNKRAQVIRMSRRGEPSEQIAAALSIPRKEVELVLKVYRLALKGSSENA